jgi:hypothetical protein
MKVKLIGVHTEYKHNCCDEYYEDLQRYIVDTISPWEEVTNDTLYRLQQFISAENAAANTVKYVLITEEQPRTVQMAISDMLQKAEADRQKALEQLKKMEEEKRQRKIKNAATKKARLEKQLKKLKDALENEAISKDAESLIEALSK